MNKNFWNNRNVFITGHTGFKGSWMSLYLSSLGANIFGYSLKSNESKCFFNATKLKKNISGSITGNILDFNNLSKAISSCKPSIIIHMAAQSLVGISYENPIETYNTNIIGTVNIFQAARQSEYVNAIINVTSDKCYENYEWLWPYRENDRLGGADPYSNSKACSELISESYRKSFLSREGKFLATVRAGNVIGGGDWSKDRLIPDFFRSIENNKTLFLRSPNSIRPWQHVLEPISGYAKLAEKLYEFKDKYAEAWNFGPSTDHCKPVSYVVDYLLNKFNRQNKKDYKNNNFFESKYLMIDSSKAYSYLGWKNKWNLEIALDKTIEWYKSQKAGDDMLSLSMLQINSFNKEL